MQWYILILLGMAGGVLGGLGMGGGTLLIPMLTMIVGYEQMQAQAINLISFVPMALCSLVVLIKNKLISIKAMVKIVPLAVIGCVLGAVVSEKIPPKFLSKIFGSFILLIGLIFIVKVVLQIIADILNSHKATKEKKPLKTGNLRKFN